MIRENLSGLLFAGVLAVNPASNALAHPLVRLLQSKQRSSRYRGGQARLGGRTGAETKDAGNIAGASETARKRSVNRSTTLLLGSESGWNAIFWEFKRDFEANAGAGAAGNRQEVSEIRSGY